MNILSIYKNSNIREYYNFYHRHKNVERFNFWILSNELDIVPDDVNIITPYRNIKSDRLLNFEIFSHISKLINGLVVYINPSSIHGNLDTIVNKFIQKSDKNKINVLTKDKNIGNMYSDLIIFDTRSETMNIMYQIILNNWVYIRDNDSVNLDYFLEFEINSQDYSKYFNIIDYGV